MARVYLSLGSNIDRYRHITAALDALQRHFAPLQVSTVYQSEAVGFDGDDFLNLVVGFDCALTVAALARQLRQIEDDNGRRRDGPKFSSRTLDIDILSYDDCVGDIDGVQLPRDEITRNAFVLLPLAQLAPERKHPQLQQSYRQLWADFNQSSQQLAPVPFRWHDQVIA